MDTFINVASEDHVTEYVFETPKRDNCSECLDICRLCLSLVKLQPLKCIKFSKDINWRFLENELEFPLPEEACESCLEKLNEILSFIKKCKESHQLYAQMQERISLREVETIKIEQLDSEYVEHKREDDASEAVESTISCSDDTDNAQIPPQSAIKKPELKICPKCGEATVTLVEHYKKSWGCKPTNYKCDSCNSHFKTKYYLNVHQKTKHDQMTFMCDVCSKVMKNPESLQRHIKQHKNGKPFVCDQCGRSFSRNEYLVQHMNVHAKIKSYVCDICCRRLTSRSGLSAHLKIHAKAHPVGGKHRRNLTYRDVVCHICKKKFALPMALKIHMRCHKEGRHKSNFCKICLNFFDNVDLYREHMSAKHSKTNESFDCSECSKRFANLEALKRHSLIHKEPSIGCNLCEKKFRVNSHLNRHLSLIHHINKGDPFRCKFCQRTFNLKENLTAHVRIHTGEKPYGCHICKESFIASSARKKHVRRVHGEAELENIGLFSAR